jgi:hypothetical protein
MTDTTTTPDEVEVPGEDPFIAPVSMEDDPAELFAGDSGTLDAEVRRVLVRLLQRRFLLAEKNRQQWRVLLDNQQVIESRLHDLFVHLVVDHQRGIAYKRQVRSAELDVPVLLRDDAYSRAETLVLVHLRTVFQRGHGAGETSVRVDVEEIEQTALTYFDPDDTNVAARQREVRAAIARLAKDGLIEEESEGRFRVTPLVEIVLSNEHLVELRDWLRAQNRGEGAGPVIEEPTIDEPAIDDPEPTIDDEPADDDPADDDPADDDLADPEPADPAPAPAADHIPTGGDLDAPADHPTLDLPASTHTDTTEEAAR